MEMLLVLGGGLLVILAIAAIFLVFMVATMAVTMEESILSRVLGWTVIVAIVAGLYLLFMLPMLVLGLIALGAFLTWFGHYIANPGDHWSLRALQWCVESAGLTVVCAAITIVPFVMGMMSGFIR